MEQGKYFTEKLAASQDRPCSMDLFIYLFIYLLVLFVFFPTAIRRVQYLSPPFYITSNAQPHRFHIPNNITPQTFALSEFYAK
jgi:hypothetical protein